MAYRLQRRPASMSPAPEEGIVFQLTTTLGPQVRGNINVLEGLAGISFAYDEGSFQINHTTGEIIAREEYFVQANILALDFTLGKTRSAPLAPYAGISETLSKVPFQKFDFISKPQVKFSFGGAIVWVFEYTYDAKQHVENAARR